MGQHRATTEPAAITAPSGRSCVRPAPRGIQKSTRTPIEEAPLAIANTPHLVAPFRNLRRSGNHGHDVNWGPG
eukprot:8438810-Pyramimonas_sp.AAC.1